jgi:D-tyrosyl-tRNA(Tyr) deacylase
VRAVVQRVAKAKVFANGCTVGEIARGLLVLLGIGQEDTRKDVEYLAGKTVGLRIFEDTKGKMNLSLQDIKGELLVVSQFTLYGDCRKGKRPGFDRAARPERAEVLYNEFLDCCRGYGIKVESGRFQTEMMVEIHNHGPVTILLDSKKEF